MKLLPETIREIPIFSGLSREDIDKVIGKMEECSFSAGTIIFSQGDRGNTFYFIESGAVQVLVKGATGTSETVALLGTVQLVWRKGHAFRRNPFRNHAYG